MYNSGHVLHRRSIDEQTTVFMMHRLLIATLIMLLVGACTSSGAPATPTPPRISKVLATVAISSTPDADQQAATRAAASPAPLPPTATINPTATPYVGVFIGQAERNTGFTLIERPLLGDDPQEPGGAPTADAAICGIPIEAAYVDVWRTNTPVRRRMGCPIQSGFGFFGETQIFESGVMYSQPDTGAVWALLPDEPRGDYFYVENPEERSTIGLDAPRGLIVPGDVFGDTWAGIDGLREQMGFAQTEPQEIALGVQRFENGTFLLDATSEQVFALLVDGTAYGPYLAPEDAQPGGQLAISAEDTPEITPEVSATP